MGEPWNTLAGVLFGYCLALFASWSNRRRKLKTHWRALRAEMHLCHRQASILIADTVQAPLYRMPITAYQASYPILLAEGAITESEIAALGEYFSLVEEINRGLDSAAQAEITGPSQKTQRESARNKLKAQHLINREGGNPSKYELAFQITDDKSR